MSLLLKYARGAAPVRTQLCLALVAMSVHLPAEHWGQQAGQPWGGGPLSWLVQRLQGEAADVSLPCMLELLTIMPQEVNSFKYAVRPERRREHAQELRGATTAALDVLASCWTLPPSLPAALQLKLRAAVLEAFGSWLRLSEGAALGPDGSVLAGHALVRAALEGLGSAQTLQQQGDAAADGLEQVFVSAADAVSELVWCSVDPETRRVGAAMGPLVQVLVPAVMALRGPFTADVARAKAQLASGEETDSEALASNVCRKMALLFADLAEAYLPAVTACSPELQPAVAVLLDVAGHPAHSVASLSFTFWHRLSTSITSGFSRDQDSDMAAPVTTLSQPGEAADLRAFYQPAYDRLVAELSARLRYPPGCETWSAEQHADFRKQRHEVADSLEDCCMVLRFTPCLGLVCRPLMALSAAVAQGQAWDWRTAEAALFSIRALGPHADLTHAGQPEQLAALLAALPTMPQHQPLLQSCICYLISRYCAWLAHGLQAEELAGPAPAAAGLGNGTGAPGPRPLQALLHSLLQLVVRCLEVHQTSTAASCALLDLCGHCGHWLKDSWEPLRALYTQLQGAGVVGLLACAGSGQTAAGARLQRPLGLSGVKEEDLHMVMQAVCVATGQALPYEQLAAASMSLLQPALSALQAAAQQLPAPAPPLPGAAAPGRGNLSAQFPTLGALLDRVTVLHVHTTDPSVVAQMLGATWPTLDMVLTRVAADSRLMERGCRLLRQAIKASGHAAGPLLPGILAAVVQRTQESNQSAYLYVLSEVIKSWGRQAADPSSPLYQALYQALHALLAHATAQLTSYQQMAAQPELVDDTFLLAVRALTYAPNLLLSATGPGASSSANGMPPPPPPPALPNLLDCALVGLLLQHREAAMSVLGFLAKLTSHSLQIAVPELGAVLAALLAARGPNLTRMLVVGVVGIQATARLGDLAEVLAAILLHGGNQALQWVGAALDALPPVVLDPRDRDAFLGAAAAVVQYGATEGPGTQLSPAAQRTWAGAVDDLADLCRRNGRMRTAAEQALLPPSLAPLFLH